MATGENERLAGRYRVVEQLGRGGMGVVWRAVDEVLGREVAVKELRTYNDSSGPELEGLRIRMQREARAAARVRHPGVVAVHDVTEHEGRPVIVMELVDGPSLDDVLSERGLLDPREAASIGARVLEALAAAHRAGVLHRDVKPGNVLLERTSGRVVLTDFGIAAMDDPGDGSATHLTRSGELVGSLDYLAPERAQGQEPGPASDVWALGATLYAAVEGGSPFRRTSTWSTLTAIVVEPLPEPRRSGPLGPVLQRLMAKDPAQRPDAEEAARMLTAVADGRDTAAPGVGLRGDEVPREATVRDVLPHRPEGFGPAGAPQTAPPVHSVRPVPPAHVTTPSPVAGAAPGRRPGRGRAALVAAGVAAVLLAGGGVTYVLTERSETASSESAKGTGESGSPRGLGSIPVGGEPSAAKKPAGTGAAGQDTGKSPRPDAKPPAGDEDGRGSDDAGEPGDSGKDSGADDDGTSGSSGGSETSGGAGDPAGATTGGAGSGGSGPTPTGGGSGPGDPAPEPVCHSIGGGKYNCTVWQGAKSYTASGAEAGRLNAGTNYFYCQQNLGRRETSGEWTNVWWAKTDDDSGNTNVFVSDVYIKGGKNDEPVPGLPVC
ncbi:serine/threonine protein phosphatase [Streptomyces agglomeratus]|uniref:serine/threonine-protein kinase n=1 Tax=Streptomyces agglomeratus TaxID=285458 RepID=UPI00086B9AFA|nr:serine/threonine-protein kinase [Streptomyces agglomeratus]OEJ57624.1 serine/threonine protein phosphatase [Streptomyces agglomeratus]